MRLIRESKTALINLSGLIADRQVIPLVGSGVSVAAGYPTWAGLLTALHERVASGRRGRSVNVGGKYVGRLEAVQDVLWRAQEYRRLLGEDEYVDIITTLFRPRRLPAANPLRARPTTTT
jgi:hypothetical protein